MKTVLAEINALEKKIKGYHSKRVLGTVELADDQVQAIKSLRAMAKQAQAIEEGILYIQRGRFGSHDTQDAVATARKLVGYLNYIANDIKNKPTE